MSLRARLFLLVLFATLIPALVGAVLFLDYRNGQITDARRNLEATARQIAQGLSTTVRSTAQLEYGLSRAREFDTNDRAVCSAFLADVLKEFPLYTGLLTIKPNGDLFCDSLRTNKTLNLKDRQYFQQALTAQNPLAIEPVFGRLSGIAVLQVAYAVRNANGVTKFVLLASVNLDKYIHLRAKNISQRDAVIVLTDANGKILTWIPNGEKMLGTSIVDTPLFRFAQERKDENIREIEDTDGTIRIWSSSVMPDLPDTGLHILVGVSKNHLLAEADEGLAKTLATLSVVWLLVFGSAWALTELGIRRQVTRIIAAVNKLGGGDSSARTGLLHTPDEFGQIARVIDGMAATLQIRETESTRDKEEIRLLNTDLERRVLERTAELAAANQELEAFSYSVSHDLRAPLRAIDGFSQAIIEDYSGSLDEKGKSYLNRIRAATQRMGMLIDDMLALSRVTRAEMRLATVDLSALAAEVFAELQKSEPGRKVDCHIEPGLTGAGDERLLRMALVNLLGNAWKFTSRKEQPRIEFGATPNADGTTEFFVRDNGTGFDMAYADKLFGVFQRLHSAAEFPGTGVGLAIVKRIIHRHGGQVRGVGIPDQGATFYFTLPG